MDRSRSGTLLYDGDCGLCVATATWLAERAQGRDLGLLALQQVDTEPDLAAQVRGRDLAASLHFVRIDGTVLTGARAVLAAGRLVPGWRLFAILADHPLGHALLEPVYREIASHRRRIGRFLGLPASCPLVTRQREAG
jgi:predicted DCC family thiol-disulfide oxidoreductase YuxK